MKPIDPMHGRLRTMKKRLFTEKDLGCWIDAAYGEKHAMLRLKSMVESCPNVPANGKPSSWTFYEAAEIFQDNTEEGLIWVWEAGDLILADESEMDENEY
jgi:hypothetical protein